MNAAHLGMRLQALGIAVGSTSEADDELDGEVVLSPLVSVQVPQQGRLRLNVWVDAETMAHHDVASVHELAGKLRALLGSNS